ncbi:GDP-mannose transporter 1 [Kwoniella mangroviensis CBS 10435]|uniref:GDP-mannose transporter n=1 Tax=Kwoniella mangroviensis CBS 10435 TaxID=1331196 RepID=A0A1B9IKY8_9TREE|nr:GDP-mannose transporter 1 [Kwoniella mangroviensis CBS 8507]OCF56318.1 GDP-mannose transporter 1 [Kwoniella mangroviensis CBS 10435]OCF62841.1 GDP-mannose transporter 1 [Kwoniella mangroviensis CBS 8507]OCF79068.1 GDP-mannose transporter 1 [Kwoniella mangroviensis CBS 8886]
MSSSSSSSSGASLRQPQPLYHRPISNPSNTLPLTGLGPNLSPRIIGHGYGLSIPSPIPERSHETSPLPDYDDQEQGLKGHLVDLDNMSKPFVPTPNISRPGTPGGGAKDDANAMLLNNLGADREREGRERREERRDDKLAGKEQALPILSYCAASIMMTVVNKYVVSGRHFTMTFLLLAIQSAVCVLAVWSVKRFGIITFRDFDMKDAKAWWPISTLLVAVIYTGSKSLQFLSIPVYTIFKNLTIILIAYGEVFMFNGVVTGLTLCSFALMVGSSIIAAWADITSFLNSPPELDPTTGLEIATGPISTIGGINAGYVWMAANCLASAAYVLFMRKRIKVTGFKDWDSMFYNNFLSIPVLMVFSLVIEDWGTESLSLNFPESNRFILLSAIAFSGAAAVFISYSTAWCVRVCGSTTYSMVGALNKLPVAASGMLFFGDPASFGNVSAIGVGGLAGIVYAVAKTNQAKVDQANKLRAAGGRA